MKNIVNVKSPITGSTNVKLEKMIDVQPIVEQYEESLGVKVRHFFVGLDQLKVYKCLDTQYRFYYPYHINGDGLFYEELQKLPWYYSTWKWDFEAVSGLINHPDRVLEIGCGDGKFLTHLEERGIDCTGLELNDAAIAVGKNKGLLVCKDTIQQFAIRFPSTYDVVCSFQVLEHITDIKSFLQASIDALKPGGKLMLCVPNNEGFLQHDDSNPFNKPPHHMGLWDSTSLANLSKAFPINLENISYEPLARCDPNWAYSVFISRMYAYHWRIGSFWKKLSPRIVHKMITLLGNKLKGHSVLAVYTKAR